MENNNYLSIIEHKLNEFGIPLSSCTLETIYSNSGTIGRENMFVFPLKVQDNMILVGQSGCINVENSEDVVSLIQLPLLWGTVRIVNEMPQKIPFLVIHNRSVIYGSNKI